MAELLEAGIDLTLVGMSVVFVLLTLLVGAIHAMSRLCRLLEAGAAAAEPPQATPAGALDEELAAVTAAVRMFRRSRARGTT